MNSRMKGLTLENIALAVSGELIGQGDGEITGVEMDSRLIEQGNLFIAIRGNKVDGHQFLEQVFNAGAKAAIVEEVPDQQKGCYILVSSSTQALKDLAKYYREVLSIFIIGVTGSVGKTSTKEMLKSIIGEHFKVESTKGNYNNEIGMPLTILSFREEHEVGIVEMGISDFGEMYRLSQIAQPNIAMITNIGDCHLENLKDRQGVLKAKSEIFEFLQSDGQVILNGNDALLKEVKTVHGKPVTFYGFGSENDVFGSDIQLKGTEGSDFILHYEDKEYPVHLSIPGEHMVLNALGGIACGLALPMPMEKILNGVFKASTIAGRSNFISHQEQTIIDDCYNANPVSMAASLRFLSTLQDRPRVAILGDMKELGEGEINYHKEVGALVATTCTKLYTLGKLSLHIHEEALKYGLKKCYHFESIEDLIRQVKKDNYSNEVLLVKASNSMGFKRIVEALSKE